MHAHIPTLFLTIITVGMVLSVSVGVVAHVRERDGMLYWSAGLAVHTLAYVLFSLRGQIPELLSVVLANTFLAASLASFTEGLYQFFRVRPPRWKIWTPVAVVAVSFVLLLDDLSLRVTVSGVILSSQCFFALWFMGTQQRATAGRGKYFLVLGLGIVATTLLFRAVSAATGSGLALTALTDANPLQTVTFMGALISMMLLSIGFVLMSKDRADAMNRMLASQDALTGLANRRTLNEALQAEAARAARSGQALSVALMDVDYFKPYNDHYGHQAGDVCLQRIARQLEAGAHRAGDLAARYGGEEFLLILPNTDAAAALKLAHGVRSSIEAQAIAHAASPLGRVTVSIGLATLDQASYKDPQSLLRAADQALYRAKQAGRNQVQSAEGAQDAPHYNAQPPSTTEFH